MNILVQIKQLTNLTENEKILVEFILNHHERFLKMSAKQISQEIFVSNSTIYRLCQKLNLAGLSELKVQVPSSFNNFILEDHELDFNYPIKQHESQYVMVQKLKTIYEQTVINTQNLIDLEILRQVAFKIKKSKYIDIYTSAGNLYFAENFKFQMQEISCFVNVPIEEYHQRLTTACSNEEHLAIVISFEGRGHSIGDICHILFFD